MICDKAVWDNSPEKRKTVGNDLDNWGTWSRDGGGCVVTSASSVFKSGDGYRGTSEAYNLDQAEETEQILSDWWRSSQSGKVGVFLLKLKYVERRALEKIGYDYRRKFKSDRPDEVVEAMIDEAEWFYWLLTQ